MGKVIFLIIIVLSIIGYYRLPKIVLKNLLLLLTCILFYTILEGYRIGILFFIIISTYLFAKFITKHNNKWLLYSGIIINVLILLLYKYIPLISEFQFFKYLPIGLSFYTFQSISYLIDIFKGKIKQHYSLIEVAIYLSFFPKIMAGPIERADSFVIQLQNPQIYNSIRIFSGLKIILLALCFKFVLANQIGVIVDVSLMNYKTISVFNILITSMLFSFQIFCDFYAYSILAIGVASLYGIELSQNFNYPYFSNSFKTFWKRWNITLTSWLRDYIYIPLGGNRVYVFQWVFNVILVFVISGIWHNASLNFILWGFLHSIFLIIERYANNIVPAYFKKNTPLKLIYSIIVFVIISLLWLIFRIEDTQQLQTIFSQLTNFDYNNIMWKGLLVVTVLSLGVVILKKSQIVENYIFQTCNHTSFILREVILINGIMLLLLFLTISINRNFIYFKF